MASTVDELSIQWEEDGEIVVKEVDKKVLTKGAWTTIAFLTQDLDRKTGEYKPKKVSIRRYRKMNGEYKAQSKFNISNKKQALQLIEILNEWFS